MKAPILLLSACVLLAEPAFAQSTFDENVMMPVGEGPALDPDEMLLAPQTDTGEPEVFHSAPVMVQRIEPPVVLRAVPVQLAADEGGDEGGDGGGNSDDGNSDDGNSDDGPPEGASTAAPNRVADFLARPEAANDLAPPDPVGFELLDEAGKQALRDSFTAYYRYRESGYVHRRAVFDYQLTSSKVIFFVVILLVLLGVYFSWLQFMAEQKAPPPKESAKAQSGDKPAAGRRGILTTFEAGTGGIKVSSPVLGVVILVISLAFFYLYLTHVYPINEVF